MGDVVAVPAGQGDRERHAVCVDDQVVPGAGTAAVDRRRPAVPPFESADVQAGHGAPIQIQLPGRAQLGEQEFMQRRPGPGLGPDPQPSPAGHSRHPDQFTAPTTHPPGAPRSRRAERQRPAAVHTDTPGSFCKIVTFALTTVIARSFRRPLFRTTDFEGLTNVRYESGPWTIESHYTPNCLQVRSIGRRGA